MKVKCSVKIAIWFIVIVLFANTTFAQSITLKGTVTDKGDKAAISGATINLINQKDSTKKSYKVTDSKGNFEFNNLTAEGYTVKISYSGYEKIEQKINLQASNKTPISFVIGKIATDLTGVTIVAKTQPVRQKGDTTEFSASQFKVNPDATAEDIIKKLPGITVARDGTVTAAGEQVRKVTVDGKDFFGDDATAALRNLPADVIDKIQVFDRLSDQAQLTGFDDGNSVKTVNIVTKSGIRNGQFGRVYAGVGTESTYTAGGNVSFFKGDRRLSIVGNFNNINQQNFASQDLLGVTSGGGGGGGNRGGGMGGGNFGGGQNNFSVGQASGINQTNAFGLNFSNVYNKKLTLSGSYFFNQSKNENESVSNRETFGSTKNLFTHQETNSTTTNYNHRINLRMEYKIDSANTLFIIPSISFQKNKSFNNTFNENFYAINDSTNISNGISNADRNGFNIRNNIMFRHSFPKRGRTLSLGFNTTFSKNDGETINDNQFRFYKTSGVTDSLLNRFTDNATNGTTIGGNIAFTEPINKKAQLQFDYTPTVQKNKADQQTFSYDGGKYSLFDTTLSNRFDNTITTHNIGVNYRLGQSRDEQLSFGLNFQTSRLQSDREFPTATKVNQTFSNILPNVMWRKKISNYSNIRLFYRANTNFPSVTQLQDVLNLTNPIRVSIGNPNLKQSYTHFLNARYTYTNTKTQNSFFANLFLQTANDFITTGTTILRVDTLIQKSTILAGSQLSKPVNVNGYKNIRTLFTYSMPIKKLKTTANLSAGYNYSILPGIVNSVKTMTTTNTFNTGLVLASNINEYVDFNVSYNVNFNNSATNTTNATATKYTNQVAGAQLNLLNKKGWFLQNDVSGNVYSGLAEGFNQRFWLWNAAIGKKIFKKQAGELKLSVFDLLKQNQSIVRTINSDYIEDVQTNVLQQYFMLTFTYKLKNFGTIPTRQNNREGGERPQFRPGGMGGGAPNF